MQHRQEMPTRTTTAVNTSQTAANAILPAEPAEFPAAYCVARWYAAYTSANHEKRVAEQLGVRNVEHFLPTFSSIRRWKDRRVTLHLPLFPGYVFVRMALRDRLRVQQVPGVARLVGFDGTPAALPGEEIEALRLSLASGVRAEPHRFLTAGRRVRVKAGPLMGLQGILVRRKKQTRFVVSVELIMRSVAIEMDEVDLEALGGLAEMANFSSSNEGGKDARFDYRHPPQR